MPFGLCEPEDWAFGRPCRRGQRLPAGTLATSTQLRLEKLRDLLIWCGSEFGLPEEVTERGPSHIRTS
jgi:hypothetical protein